MLSKLPRAMMVGAALLLGACETNPETEALVFDSQEAAAPVVKVPVQAVRSVELGRTRDGFIITAFGTAPGLGYAQPSLRPRRSGAPGADGFVDFDFVAVQPDPDFKLPQGTTRARALRADLPVTLRNLKGAQGIRVHALAGGVQLTF